MGTPIEIKEFTSLYTAKSAQKINLSQMSLCINMEYRDDGTIYKRRGLVKRKTNSQWSNVRVLQGTAFNVLGTSYFYHVNFLENSKIFYIKNTDFTSSTSTFTELLSMDGASPALQSASNIRFVRYNSKLYVIDGSANVYYWDGVAANLKLMNDPKDFRWNITVPIGSAATVGDTYTSGSATIKIEATKTAGTGTSLTVRQISGDTRPPATGTLTRASGTGDLTITYSALVFPQTYTEIGLYKRRLGVLSTTGVLYLTDTPSVGTDFALAGAGFIEYDLDMGMKATGFLPYKRGAVISTENAVLEEFSISTLTGFRFYLAAEAGSESGQFKVERESNIHGIVGRSGQEIGNTAIGLSRNGFITLAGLQQNTEFGLTNQDVLSRPIKNYIEKVNFNAVGEIFSCLDTLNQRYICAVPLDTLTKANALFIYDYGKSTPDEPKWSIHYLSINSISCLYVAKKKVYIGDGLGNVYEAYVNGVYSDDGNAYTARFESAAFGEQDDFKDKKIDNIFVEFKVPYIPESSPPLTLQAYTIVDDEYISKTPDGSIIQQIEIRPKRIYENKFSRTRKYDRSLKWGQITSPYFFMKHTTLAGKGRRAVIGVTNNSSSDNWGISSIVVEVSNRGTSSGD